MKRKIEFRGKRVDGKGWAYGDLNQNCMDLNLRYCIGIKEGRNTAVEVIPETVGQLTGSTDIDGNLLYEDDILCLISSGHINKDWNGIKYIKKVSFFDGGFVTIDYSFDGREINYLSASTHFKKIGNAIDNPELLVISK